MGIKAKIEERERLLAKERSQIKANINIMEEQIEIFKDQNLPSTPFMEATLAITKKMVKGRYGL